MYICVSWLCIYIRIYAHMYIYIYIYAFLGYVCGSSSVADPFLLCLEEGVLCAAEALEALGGSACLLLGVLPARP